VKYINGTVKVQEQNSTTTVEVQPVVKTLGGLKFKFFPGNTKRGYMSEKLKYRAVSGQIGLKRRVLVVKLK
jgi:hypothetical protein